MRGNGYRNIIADNLSATSGLMIHEKWTHRKRKLCWKCQKDKPQYGAHLDLSMGVHKFICKDCMDAKAAKLKEQA